MQAALDKSPSGFTIRDVLDRIAQGRALLWTNRKSAAVTHTESTLVCWLAGGDRNELLEMLEQAEALAREQGLEGVCVIDGRKGWERVLSPLGYEKQTVLFKKV